MLFEIWGSSDPILGKWANIFIYAIILYEDQIARISFIMAPKRTGAAAVSLRIYTAARLIISAPAPVSTPGDMFLVFSGHAMRISYYYMLKIIFQGK